MCVQYEKKIFPSVQVKNKPRDEGTEHAFILGSIDCTVVNSPVLSISTVHQRPNSESKEETSVSDQGFNINASQLFLV